MLPEARRHQKDHEMTTREMTSFVNQVVADAEALFGPNASPAQLERHARRAVLNLTVVRPDVDGCVAANALHQVQVALALRALRTAELAA